METVRLSTLPVPLVWETPPQSWELRDDRLSITAGPQTDLFRSPQGNAVHENSPRLLFYPSGDWTLHAQVHVEHEGTFDAGVLLIYEHNTSWAKLCFEFSPQRQPMIVSVVTRGLSDDCNSVVIEGHDVWLRIAHIGHAFAMHYSTDGSYWHMVRHFTLDNPDRVAIGFSSQAPRGQGCTATFSDIQFAHRTIQDIRSGE